MEKNLISPIRHVGRLAVIVNTFARHGFWSVVQQANVLKFLSASQRHEASRTAEEWNASQLSFPVRLKLAFEELGPAFVKLGQILAVREDLLSDEYTSELKKLHDHVETLPFSEVSQVLKAELGEQKLRDFVRINPEPLAAGSIAQVHEAELLNGERVVIKVQRPNIDQLISSDLALMEVLAGLLEKYEGLKHLRLQTTVHVLGQALKGELDFIREAGATEKISKNFIGIDYVKIPNVHWDYTSLRVLTLEKLDGYSVQDRNFLVDKNLSPEKLVEHGLRMFLKMVFVDGFFHGDLHPGNLLALPNGTLGILDFGLTGRVSRSTRENLAGMLQAIVAEDYERVVSHFLEIAESPGHININHFQQDIANAVSPYVGLSLLHVKSGRLLWDLARIAAKHQAPLPQELVLFIKTMSTFEGLGFKLNPNFNALEICEEFAGELAENVYSQENIEKVLAAYSRDLGSLFRHTPFLLRKLLTMTADGQLKVSIRNEEALRLTRGIERASSRISVSVIIAALLVGSSLMTAFSNYHGNQPTATLGVAGFSTAGILGLYVIWSILKR